MLRPVGLFGATFVHRRGDFKHFGSIFEGSRSAFADRHGGFKVSYRESAGMHRGFKGYRLKTFTNSVEVEPEVLKTPTNSSNFWLVLL